MKSVQIKIALAVSFCLFVSVTGLMYEKRKKHTHHGEHYLPTLSWVVKLKQPFSNQLFCASGLGSCTLSDNYVDGVARIVGLHNTGHVLPLEDVFVFTHPHQESATDILNNIHFEYKNAKNKMHNPVNGDDKQVFDIYSVLNGTSTFHNYFALHLLKRHNLTQEYWQNIIDNTEDLLDKNELILWYYQDMVKFRFHHVSESLYSSSVNETTLMSNHPLIRTKRKTTVFNDPQYPRQWHLVNTMYTGYDVNVTGVWNRNITGKGINVVVVDDGMEWNNPDLLLNYNKKGSCDLNSGDDNPMPTTEKGSNHHGTRCAGEIAAVPNNNICGVGVAYDAKIGGIRILDGPMTDTLEAKAFTAKMEVNDVYSCSWGPEDDGQIIDGPHHLALEAMRHGVDYGRHGYGSIYIFASGNGGLHQDNCNFDGYANSIYTLTVGAVDEVGSMPYYAEECASMLAVTFSSGSYYDRQIVTTDWTKLGGTGCTDQHTGTSAAAPLCAGMVTLMLQARPCLTWRDVQYIIVMTAVKIDVDVAEWHRNKAGLHHSHKHGFGLMDAWRLVNAAKVWKSVPWRTAFTSEIQKTKHKIPEKSQPLKLKYEVTPEMLEGYGLATLEYIQVTVSVTHPRRGDLKLIIECPSRTPSVIAAPRPNDKSNYGFKSWTFSTVRCWGEKPDGTYTMTIIDTGDVDASRGELTEWQLQLHGSSLTHQQFKDKLKEVQEAASGAYLNDSFSLPCNPPPLQGHFTQPISDRILKILVIGGLGLVVLAIWELIETVTSYKEEKEEQKKMMTLATRALQIVGQGQEGSSSERTRLLATEESVPLSNILSQTQRNESQNSIRDLSEGVGLQEEETSFMTSSNTGALGRPDSYHVNNVDLPSNGNVDNLYQPQSSLNADDFLFRDENERN